MKSSIKKNTFKAIYRLLDKVSPVNGDCGLLCGSICCTYEYENADYSNIDDAARTATDSSSSTGDTGNGGSADTAGNQTNTGDTTPFGLYAALLAISGGLAGACVYGIKKTGKNGLVRK